MALETSQQRQNKNNKTVKRELRLMYSDVENLSTIHRIPNLTEASTVGTLADSFWWQRMATSFKLTLLPASDDADYQGLARFEDQTKALEWRIGNSRIQQVECVPQIL